jgi:hypothetical protein
MLRLSAGLLLAASTLTACQTTRLSLRVRTPGEPALADTRVTLLIDDEPVCGGGVLFFGRTDREGLLKVHTPACGPSRLVVARPGRRTVIQKLDSCETKSLEVVLWPMSPQQLPGDACGRAAYDFLQARRSSDSEQARASWLHPDDYRAALQSAPSVPWATEVESTREGSGCRVRATELHDNGCEIVWRLELVQNGDRWLIRSMQPEAPAQP